ncbi:hypothetical protein [Brevibacillus agri]|uniref:hypothetical protein n=1 Tax=Brevibacillus agri TaxID=51101 RepID=UPI001EE5B4E2|nr:hypothetical protein [Brevibacillus agri]MCG5252606.1 hypothetical protein [Brevibacillus agri]
MKRKSNETTTRHFRGHADYKAAFSEAVTELIASNRANPIPRHERMRIIGALTDEYVASTGERPDGAELERLANAVLHEELTDRHPDKVTREEYPIMSDVQLKLRHDREVSLWVAKALDQDGIDRKPPKRRMRSKQEHAFMDRVVKSRNKERARKHREAMRPGPVVTYSLPSDLSPNGNA